MNRLSSKDGGICDLFTQGVFYAFHDESTRPEDIEISNLRGDHSAPPWRKVDSLCVTIMGKIHIRHIWGSIIMTEQECNALAEVGWRGLVDRNFRVPDLVADLNLMKLLMASSQPFLSDFRSCGLLLISISDFETELFRHKDMREKYDIYRAMGDILRRVSNGPDTFFDEYDNHWLFRNTLRNP